MPETFPHRPIAMMSLRLAVRRGAAMRAVGALALGTLCSCSGCAAQPETLATGEEYVILPRIVYVQPAAVGPNTPFRLEVVSRGTVGNPTDPEPITWTSSNMSVTIVPDHSRGTAVVTMPALAAGDNVVITARNGARSSSSLIVFRLASSAGWDEARDDLVAGASPSVAMVTGEIGGGCVHDRVDAFNGSAIIGRYGVSSACDRAEATIFSEGAAPQITRPFAWTAVQDVTDATGNGGAIAIPMQLVIGVEDADAVAADADEANFLLTAGDTYRASRSGIDLLPSAQTIIRQVLPASITKCADVPAIPAAVAPQAKKLNIYHIAKVVDANGTILRGVFCAPNVILIAHGLALQNTLAHEVAHALGLISPAFGHIDGVSGFIRDNVMSTDAAEGQDDRHRLSLGQLFRMHVDGRSWLRRNVDLTDGPFTCSCDPYATNVCPALPADLRPLLAPLPAPGAPCS